MFNQQLLAAVSAATLALTVACSSGASATPARSQSNSSAPSTAAQLVTVRGLDTMRFEPAQLTFENAGATIHDFTLTSDQGVAQKVQAVAQSKTSSVANFTIERPGTYTFVCDQPGHAPAGMRGTIVVQ